MKADYSKRGIREKEHALHTVYPKIIKKLLLAVLYLALIAMIGVAIIGASAGFGVFKGIIDTSPSIENVDVTPTGFSTFVYDNEGNQIAKLVSQDSNRIPVTMDMIPENLAHAFVAIEDERYYEHNGIDIKGIIRAAYMGISNGFHFTEGASTITQQLLKNNVFVGWTEEDGFSDRMKRKIQEQYLAIELSKTMSKDDILLNYMNTINLGQNTLGVQAASMRYFNKSVSTLSLSECAVIAGITQNPSKYNPVTHPDKNAERRDKVLRKMLEQGYISQSEYDTAIADDVYSRIEIVNDEVDESLVNSYFVDALTDDVLEDLQKAGYNDTQAFTLLYSGGLKIYSTQDPDIQKICDEAFTNEENFPSGCRWLLSYALTVKKANGDLDNHSSEMYKKHFKEKRSGFDMIYDTQEEAYAEIETYKEVVLKEGDEVYDEKVSLSAQPQVSMTIEDQHTGYVVAMVGGRGPKEGSRTLNRATDTKRQPGSTFKIVAGYAPGLDSGMITLATAINDAPFNYANGRPVNNWYSGYRGLSNVRQGIIDSMNILATKVITYITPQLAFDYLQNFGFTTLVEREERYNATTGKTEIYSDIQQSTVLGGLTYGVTNEELNAAYAAIANGGTYIKPKLYTKIVDHDGNVIIDNTVPETRQVVKENVAWLLTSAMQDVVTSGTGAAVNFGNMAIAGKTGTTTANNDLWFAGYTPYYTATVWEGYDNNTKLRSGEERNISKRMWRLVMSQIHADLEYQSFEKPSGIVTATVCACSGKLPIAGLCDAHLKTEYFAEGTVPTETCDVHYQGAVCQYEGLPAQDTCPFKVEGVIEVLPDNVLMSGDANAGNLAANVTPEEGEENTPMRKCIHDPLFMAQPNIDAIIELERQEMMNAAAAAQQAAEAAKAQADADALAAYYAALAAQEAAAAAEGGDTGE
ncbi:MAG: transglycosylase domain-containing protein [Lachnospiraceae bacterium]|nr:transglycosylase domain-containing protein [Lachnospiraceae bacterium]